MLCFFGFDKDTISRNILLSSSFHHLEDQEGKLSDGERHLAPGSGGARGRGGDCGKVKTCSAQREWSLLGSSIVTMQECRPHLADLPMVQEKPEIWGFIWNLLIFKRWQLIQIKTLSGQEKHICGVEVATGCLLVTSDEGRRKCIWNPEIWVWPRLGDRASGAPSWPLWASVFPSV